MKVQNFAGFIKSMKPVNEQSEGFYAGANPEDEETKDGSLS